jgi:hypothetical protein
MDTHPQNTSVLRDTVIRLPSRHMAETETRSNRCDVIVRRLPELQAIFEAPAELRGSTEKFQDWRK